MARAAPSTRGIPALQDSGASSAPSVSGTFLWIIGILNLIVLIDIVRMFGEMQRRRRTTGERLENGCYSGAS